MEPSYAYFLHLLHLFVKSNFLDTTSLRNIKTDQASLLAIKSSITLESYHTLLSNWSNSNSVSDWIGVICGMHHQRVTTALNISVMNLTGTLSPQLGNLSFLVSLHLSGNKFHGNLPDELVNLHRLRFMRIDGNHLSGELPGWLSSLSELQDLYLPSNCFTGLIPYSISNLSKLEELNLSYNQLIGSIPSKIFKFSSLGIIDLGVNKLYGDLPIDICHNLPRLNGLILIGNELGGQIPSTTSNCLALLQFSLSYNRFSGVYTNT